MRRWTLWGMGLAIALLLAVGSVALVTPLQQNRASLALAALANDNWCSTEHLDRAEARLEKLALRAPRAAAPSLERLEALRSLCATPAAQRSAQVPLLWEYLADCLAAGSECAIPQAALLYETAPGHPGALQALYTVHAERGNQEQVDAILAEFATMAPQVTLAAPPTVDGWLLEGYDLDDVALAFDDRLEMTLYWRSASRSTVDAPQLVEWDGHPTVLAGERAFQLLRAPNAVVNGGFEQTVRVHSGSPYGFGEDRYQTQSGSRALPTGRRVRVAERDGASTLCAELDNSAAASWTGLISSEVLAQPGEQWLIAAQVQNAGPGTRVGMLRERPEDALRNAYVPEAAAPLTGGAGAAASGWSTFAGLLPVEGETHAIRLQLLNQDDGHILCFDNALLLRLAPPTAPLPAPVTSPVTSPLASPLPEGSSSGD